MRFSSGLCIIILAVVLSFACNTEQAPTDAKIKIVATTGMIADAAQNLCGEQASITSLLGPGVDPHLYKPTQADLIKLRNADIILYNGLGLEGKMTEILEKLAQKKKVFNMAANLPQERLLSDPNYENAYDPHFWFDVDLWSTAVADLSNYLAKELNDGEEVARKAGSYLTQLDELHAETLSKIGQIPEHNKMLVTTHDAFSYFSSAYSIEVTALQGFSTMAEIGIKDITNMVSLLTERQIPAVFVESSVSKKALTAVVQGCAQKGHELKLGGSLFADADRKSVV